MTEDDVSDQLEAFLRMQYAIRADDTGFARDVDLFDRGYVDSVGLVELLAFITGRFNVEIEDDDLLSDDFATVQGMAKVVCRQVQTCSDLPK